MNASLDNLKPELTMDQIVGPIDKATKISDECRAEVVDIERSREGVNSFFHHCDRTSQRASYAACLSIRKLVDEDSIRVGYVSSACIDAVRRDGCPAAKMRAVEEKAGRALFFRDGQLALKLQEVRVAQRDESIRYGKPRAPRDPLTPVSVSAVIEKNEPKTQSGLLDQVPTSNIYADAINEMTKATAP